MRQTGETARRQRAAKRGGFKTTRAKIAAKVIGPLCEALGNMPDVPQPLAE